MNDLGDSALNASSRRTGDHPESVRLRRLAIGRMLLGIHRLQVAAFGGLQPEASRSLAPGSYQEILLDLYLAGLEKRQVYQSCVASTAPPATVHRKAARLEKLGALLRAVDAHDHRRLNLTLTPTMRAVLDVFIDTMDRELHLGFRSAAGLQSSDARGTSTAE